MNNKKILSSVIVVTKSLMKTVQNKGAIITNPNINDTFKI